MRQEWKMRKQYRSEQRRGMKQAAMLVAAAVGAVGYQHVTEATTFVISTSGATALGGFNRGNSGSDPVGNIVRGPYAVGQSIGIQIGNTSYAFTGGVKYFGTGTPDANGDGAAS